MPHSRGRRVALVATFLAVFAAALPVCATGAAAPGAPSQPAADAAALAQPQNATIETVSFAGAAATNTSDGRRVVWQEKSFDMTLKYQPPNRSNYAVCAWTGDVETEVCTDLHIGDPQNQTSETLSLSGWPTDTTGPQNLSVELRGGEQTLAEHTREVIVLEQNQSFDGDSLSNSRELDMNTSVLTADTDEDGINDGVEVRTYDTDPTDPDTDDDGVRDGREIELGTDPTDSDHDSDDLRDGREIELGTDPTDPDSDDDGIQDGREVNLGTDPTDADTDDDGLDDARELEVGTDPTDADTDDDGLQDGRELDAGTDPTDPDTDGDGLSDSTEVALGTNPTSATTPFTLATAVLVTAAVLGLLAVRRLDGVTVEWLTNDRLPVAVPVIARAGDAEQTDERAIEPAQPQADVVQAEDAWPQIGDQALDPDHETVLSILQDNDGRVRQSEIVEETDWSAAKVSRTLSDMESDEQVSKVTIGRENIVTLYGEEPTTTTPGAEPKADGREADGTTVGEEPDPASLGDEPDPTVGEDGRDTSATGEDD